MNPNLDLIINRADPGGSGRLYLRGSTVVEGPPRKRLLLRGDQGLASVRVCDPCYTGERGFNDVDISGYTVAMALGLTDQIPTSGTFTLTFGADTTDAIEFDATAETVQDALRGLASILSAGSVTVISPATGVYEVSFITAGARAAISSATPNLLVPASTVDISEAQAGTVSVKEIQVIRLLQNPYCYGLLTTAFDVAAATVTTVQTQTASLSAIKKLTLTPIPYGGTFMVTLDGTTFEAPFDATTAQMQSLAGSNYTVVRRASNAWEFTRNTVNTAMTLTATVTNLSVPIGATGSMPLTTTGLYRAFMNTDADTLQLPLAVQLTSAGNTQKIFQETIDVHRDVVGSGGIVNSTYSSSLTIGAGTDLAVSTAGTSDLAPGYLFAHWFQLVTAAAGSGAYTRKLTLDTSLAVHGAIFIIEIDFAASTNPTISIYNESISGTLLQTVSGKSSAATYFLFKARYDSVAGAWKKFEGEFVQ